VTPGSSSSKVIREEEFDSLFRRERDPMLRLAVLLVGSRAVAEEIVQDAFVVTSERWSGVMNHGAYLRTCVVNGCRMTLRRRATESRINVYMPDVIDPPTELVELRDALARLSERQRTAIVLRYFVDLADAEIAQTLGVRETTVRSLVRRALRVLAKELV
jgi:RNA polymerase sigma factor (sigma-70 family)